MKEFKKLIGGSVEDVQNLRVQNCVNSASAESKMEVMNKRKEFRTLQTKLEDLLDLGITNTQDVATNVRNIDPNKFTSELYDLAEQMLIVARQLKLRIKVHNILFPDDKENDISKDEIDFLEGLV